MKKFFKFILILALIGAIVYGAYYAYKHFVSKKTSISLINSVPQEAVFFVETDNLSKAWTSIYNSDIWLYLSQTSYFSELNKDIEQINKFLDSSTIAGKILKNRPLILSAVMVSPQKSDYLFSIDLQNSSSTINSLKELLKVIPNYKYQETEYQTQNKKYKICILENKKNINDRIYISIISNILILSMNGDVIQKSLDQISDKHWENNKNFKEIAEKTQKINQFKIYLNFKQLQNYAQTLLTTKDATIETLSSSLMYSIFDLEIIGNQLKLKGIANTDTIGGFVKALANMTPGEINAFKYMSNQTAAIVSITFENYKDFYTKLMEQYAIKYPEESKDIDKTTNLLKKIIKIDIEKDFFSWIGNEISICKIRPITSQSRQEDVAVYIQTNDINKSIEGLDNITTQIRRWSPFKAISYQYKNYPIYFFKFKGFFKLFFGKIFEKIENPYYTIINNYIIFANSEELLQKIIDDNLNNETLANDDKKSSFISQFISKSNLNVFIFMPKMYNTLFFFSPQKNKEALTKNQELIKSFSLIGYQLISDKNFFKTILIAQYDNDAYYEDITQTLEYESFNDVLIKLIDTLGFKLKINPTIENGLYVEYFENTKDKKIETNLIDKNPDGICKTYFLSGNINSLVTFHKGKADGSATFYYDNETNSIRAELVFENDKIDGIYQEYYPDGQLKLKINFKDGTKQGNAFFYHKNGKLKIAGKYSDNQKDSKWEYYDETEKLLYTEKWRNGKRVK